MIDATAPVDVPLSAVDRQLTEGLRELHDPTSAPMYRARMSNLVIYCDDESHLQEVEASIPQIVSVHPARVFLLVANDSSSSNDVRATVQVRRAGAGSRMAAEQVTLRGGPHGADHLPFAVRALLIGDLPTNVWWASRTPPPFAGPVLDDLCESAQQLIYDSLGWADPHRGMAATSAWLSRFEREGEGGRWRVASDLNWRRLKYWLRLISQELSPAVHPGALDTISEVLIEHGPHAVTQAWQIGAWLASRLDWKIQATKFKKGSEIGFQFERPEHGTVRLRLDRLEEGAAEIRRVKIACAACGELGSLDFTSTGDGRLAVQPEEAGAEPRTLSEPAQSLVEMVAKQLSDREPDNIFREMVKAAHVLVQASIH